jgi:hypothetical protein
MDKGIQVTSRASVRRQWLGIEVSAYVVLCVTLVTVAWANNRVSGVAAVGVWVIAGGILTLALREIYRRHQRRVHDGR